MKLIFILILYIFFKVKPFLSNNLSTSEYNCAYDISEFLIDTTFIFNGTYGYEFCDNKNFFCYGDSVVRINFNGSDSFGVTYLNCFKQLSYLKLDHSKMPLHFFSTNIISPINEIIINEPSNDISFSNVKLNPSIKIFNFIGKSPSTMNFNFSSFSDVQNLTIKYIGTDPNWTYYNDLTSNKTMSSWSIVSSNVPSFNLMKINFLNIFFTKQYSETSKNNYITLKDISSIKFELFNISNSFEIQFPVEIFNFERNSQEIEFSIPFLKVSNLLDFSTFTNNSGIKKLTLSNPGLNFNFNLKFPFINLKNSFSNINQFSFNNGNFNNIPNLSIFGMSISILDLSNNLINDTLPEFERSKTNLKFINLSKNNITGIIPSSWCELENINLTNNNLNGDLPLCFSCFYSINSNQFKNNPNLIVPTITNTINYCKTIPNLIFNNNDNCFYLFGLDLGSKIYFKTNQDLIFENDWEIIIPNKKFKNCINNETILNDLPKLFEFYYPSNGNNFTLSIERKNPIITEVQIPSSSSSPNNGTVIFIGSYFSYNSSIINILVNGYQCLIEISKFNYLLCKTDIDAINENKYIFSIITINEQTIIPPLTTKISFIPTIESTKIIQCNELCLENQFCANDIGKCKCLDGYFGSTCDGIVHFVSSVNSVDRLGGIVTLYGEFGPVHDNASIEIGNLLCEIIEINNFQASCRLNSFPENSLKIQLLNFTQNNLIWISNEIYQICETILNCPNDCNQFSELKSGNCNKTIGLCNCNIGWTGFDCSSNNINGNSNSSSSSIKPNTTIDNNGTTIISLDFINFQILITKLSEIKFDNSIYKTFNLSNNWNVLINNNNNNFYKFQQIIPGNRGYIEFTIEESINDKEYEFIDTKYKLEKGSIKISINITNYQFNNQLNTLQLEIESKINNNNNNNNNCNIKKESLETFNQQQLNYIIIQKDKKQLYGRFINRILSNGKPTLIDTKSIKNSDNTSITLLMSLPHCTKSCIIDPDFSALLSIDHKSSCKTDSDGNIINESDKGLPKTTIIAVVISIVGVATLFGIGLLIYRKKRVENELAIKLKNAQKK
ncbi:hypothetical protein ACTFIY_011010 [Dictyostelium cf. discoideum]